MVSLKPVLLESSSQSATAIRRLGQLRFPTDSFSSERYERPPGLPQTPETTQGLGGGGRGGIGGQEEGVREERDAKGTNRLYPT